MNASIRTVWVRVCISIRIRVRSRVRVRVRVVVAVVVPSREEGHQPGLYPHLC